MSFYLYISDKMTLEQGNLYKKKKKSYEEKEGFTTAFPNAVPIRNEEDQQRLETTTDNFQRSLSDYARTKQIALQETKDYLTVASRDNKYKGQNVTLSTGVSGYVTQQGLFKPFSSKADMDATVGKNNCPSGSNSINTGSSTYTPSGRNVAGLIPFPVGSPMIAGQRCGNEGTNIFVSSVSEGGKKNYVGCKKNNPALQLTPYGKKADVPSVPCPAGTFQCPNGATGYCYDPSIKSMVSTYMTSTDASPGTSIPGKNSSYLSIDGVTNLWVRQSDNYDQSCGPIPTVPPCPKGTVQCPNGKPGYCWYPSVNAMVTTFQESSSDIDTILPTYMFLVLPSVFNGTPYLSNSPVNTNNLPLQTYYYDRQTTNPSYNLPNKIYDQFKNTTQTIASYLKDGKSAILTVISGGNDSNNSRITITRTGNNTASISIYYSNRQLFGTVNYTYDRNFPVVNPPIYSEDGNTKLWVKQTGWDTSCGKAAPSVPPVQLSSPDLTSCENAARMSGKPIYAFGDGQCYIGSNINSANAGITSENCVDMGSGNVGLGDSVSVYQIPGASSDGLGKYGFITADGKIKEYPDYMIIPSDKFKVFGNYKIPASSDNSYLTKILSGIPDVESCQKTCINKLGDNCNGIAFNPHVKTCEMYGSGTYPNGSPIEKSQDFTLYLRQKQINNDISCPKEITWVDSSVWNGYPKDGVMQGSTPCNLAAVTEDAYTNELQSLGIINNVSNNVESNINSLTQLSNKLNSANQNSNREFEEGVAVYNDLYNASLQLQGKQLKSLKEGFTSYDDLRSLYEQINNITSISENTEKGMKEDTERYLASQTAKFAAWGILAVSLVMGTIKFSNS